MVALSREDVALFTEYLKRVELNVDLDVSYDRSQFSKVSGTPTVLVVDHDGRVRGAWIGAIPAERERELYSALGL